MDCIHGSNKWCRCHREELTEVMKILTEEGAIISDKHIEPDCDWYRNCKIGEEIFDIDSISVVR